MVTVVGTKVGFRDPEEEHAGGKEDGRAGAPAAKKGRSYKRADRARRWASNTSNMKVRRSGFNRERTYARLVILIYMYRMIEKHFLAQINSLQLLKLFLVAGVRSYARAGARCHRIW